MGSEAKAEGMTGCCKIVSAGPKHRGRTQEGKREFDGMPQGYWARLGHWRESRQNLKGAGDFEGAARHAPLAKLLLSQPSWLSCFHEMVRLL